MLVHAAYDCAADHHSVRAATNDGCVFRCRDAESHGHRKVGVFFDLEKILLQGVGNVGAFTGHAFARDVVNETLGRCGDFAQTNRGCGWGDQPNGFEAVEAGQLLVGDHFLGWQIQNQHAIDTDGGSFSMKVFKTMDIDRVQVGVENDGNLRDLANLGNGSEYAFHSCSSIQSPLRRHLVDDAIRQRVRKWNAQLDEINAGLFQLWNQTNRLLQVGIASGDVGNKTGFAPMFEIGKFGVDAVYHKMIGWVLGPNRVASKSLHPKPKDLIFRPMALDLTEPMLAAWAGWTVVHEARKLVAKGKVLKAVHEPPFIRGAVRSGSRIYGAGFKLAPDRENLCSCFASWSEGKFCVHSVAVALVLLKQDDAKIVPHLINKAPNIDDSTNNQ